MANLVVARAPLVIKVRDVGRANDRRCEIGQPPVPPIGSQQPTLPYTILYGIDGGDFYGGLSDPDSCATAIVQLSHFARNGRDVELIADEWRRILLGRLNGVWLNSLDSTDPVMKVGGRRSLGLGSLDMDEGLASLHERYEFLITGT